MDLENSTDIELTNIIHDLHQAISIYGPYGLAGTFANGLAKSVGQGNRCLVFIDTLLLMS